MFNANVGLSKFLKTLDDRAEASVKETKKHVCERKKRIVVPLLSLLHPVMLLAGPSQRTGLKVSILRKLT